MSGGWQYLEVVPDTTETAAWGCFGTLISGADGTGIGHGEQNTADIVSGCGEANTAADYCYDFSYGGYDDWFLPSVQELQEVVFSGVPFHWRSGAYWTSTESNADMAHRVFNGTDGIDIKFSTVHWVMPIRAF